MRCINHQFTIMHRLAGNLLTNKLTGLNLSGKRADSEGGKRGALSVSGSDAHREATPLSVLSSRVRPQREPVSSCALDGHRIGGSACESG